MKNHYGGTEYLVAKMIAEVPMDCSFSVAFAYLLKKFTNLNISLGRLTSTLAVTTVVTDLLGFAVGSIGENARLRISALITDSLL